MGIFLLILGLFLFLMLVVLHEYGHFLAAKKNGVEVEEFGVGFPPRLYGKRLGKGIWESFYSINLIPLGGFVKLKGEHDSDTEVGSYGAAKLKAKVMIMLAGVMMNLLTAFVLFTILAVAGMPQVIDNQFRLNTDSRIIQNGQIDVLVDEIVEGSPAAKAGLKVDDKILSIGDKQITRREKLPEATAAYKSQTVNVKYVEKATSQEKSVEIKLNEKSPYLGVVSRDELVSIEVRRSTWTAPVVAVGTIGQFTKITLSGLGSIVTNLFKGNVEQATENTSGPIGIFVILKEGARLGLVFVLFIIAVISLTLAIMNALPIPALDGGRLFVTLFFRVFKLPLTKKTEEIIHGTGFVTLLILMFLISIVDVKRFF